MATNDTPNQPPKATLTNMATQQQAGHVYHGDTAAEFADRRNQIGQAFDESVNEFTTGTEVPDSTTITEQNRYATVDNAQTRTINPDGSIPSTGSE